MTSPPGFEEAEIGGNYVKIGVGVLKKDEVYYEFFPQHELIRGAVTHVDWGSKSARFHQVCAPCHGYGYDLAATVTLGNGTICVNWSLENKGSNAFETQHYTHNCFRFDHQPVGPGYAINFPYDMHARGLNKEQHQSGRSILFPVRIPETVNIEVDYPAAYRGSNTLTAIHQESGLSVNCLTSIRGVRTAIHGAECYLCPEQMIAIHLNPGEYRAWSCRYEFAVQRRVGEIVPHSRK